MNTTNENTSVDHANTRSVNRPFPTLILLAGLAVGFVAGGIWGWRHQEFSLALQENKLAVNNLTLNATNISPEFREYLKARIYCNIYNYYPGKAGYLIKKDWDFGPVDVHILGRIAVWKDPDGKVFDWDSAVKDK